MTKTRERKGGIGFKIGCFRDTREVDMVSESRMCWVLLWRPRTKIMSGWKWTSNVL